ncbi:hypothetical protein CCACVL1_23548 [Corchorus capsularis]|uniref:Uncharacterized protein n=1 Tax=Corchorus capsularis TaxID=210143 RepID=A0A1R3GTJ9_COCAP|nr:hypothetical protein CCACVL1_23548 [Corchorus capsularis]
MKNGKFVVSIASPAGEVQRAVGRIGVTRVVASVNVHVYVNSKSLPVS